MAFFLPLAELGTLLEGGAVATEAVEAGGVGSEIAGFAGEVNETLSSLEGFLGLGEGSAESFGSSAFRSAVPEAVGTGVSSVPEVIGSGGALAESGVAAEATVPEAITESITSAYPEAIQTETSALNAIDASLEDGEIFAGDLSFEAPLTDIALETGAEEELGGTIAALEGTGISTIAGPTTFGGLTLEQLYNTLVATGQIAGAVGNVAGAITAVSDVVSKGIDLYRDTHGLNPRITDVIVNKNDLSITDPYKYGSDLSKYIVLTQKEMMNGASERQASELVISRHPELYYLVQIVQDFSANAPKPAVNYDEISKVYNGRGIDHSKVYIKYDLGASDGYFAIVDEAGVEQFYTGAKGYVPPVHGIWCGPFSPNDKKPIDLLDTFCFMHDIDYNNNGYFHLEADLKFLARINGTLDRMGLLERVKAQQIAKYFTTIGYTLATMKQGLPSDVDEVPYTENVNDIYSALTNDTDAERRRIFYKGLRTSIGNYTELTSGASGCSCDFDNKELLLFDMISVLDISL